MTVTPKSPLSVSRSKVESRKSKVRDYLLSFICYPLSVICYPLSVICYPLSVICYLRILPAAVLALLLAGCAIRAPRLSPVGEFSLPQDAPEGLSGIAWCGDDDYALAEDSGGRIHHARIALDTATGAITNCIFTGVQTIPGLVDAEGIACERESGLLYVSDEAGAKILKILSDADPIRVPLPDFFSKTRPNKSLEALSCERTGHGFSLWTANEDALTIDGPPSSATNAPLVRIARIPPFAMKKDACSWWFYQLDAAQGGPIPGAGKDVPFNGLVGLAALGDGKLLVLERSCGLVTAPTSGALPEDPPSFITSSIYFVDTSRTTPGSPTPLKKTLLWRQGFPFSNYEGITLGPKLADDSRAVILVADGDVSKARVAGMTLTLQWKKALFALRFSGDSFR